MSSRQRTVFVCDACGAAAPKWAGQCPSCDAWNSLVEAPAVGVGGRSPARAASQAGGAAVQALADIDVQAVTRLGSGLPEFDRVLGGGFVPGSVVLLGGDPGIGKSTLLLQSLAHMSGSVRALYVTGEESLAQIALRAARLGLDGGSLQLLAENRLETMLDAVASIKPAVLVADSVQTFYTDSLTSAPGSVAQVREIAARLVRVAKESGCVVILVGHVTKEGHLAGPRVLEHMVDAVLYFEGDRSSRFRLVRAFKNRFGAVNEIGVFAMTERGLRAVGNPSAMFIRRGEVTSGSVILATQEGTRPLLVEVQALVDPSTAPNPRRVTAGLEANRLALLLAILHRHAGSSVHDQDVFINVAGGVRINETAADLAVMLAIVSSMRDRPLDPHTVVFGEVGLAGEVRPVQRGLERLREARELGFTRAVMPRANRPKGGSAGIEVVAVKRVTDALAVLDVDRLSRPAAAR